MSDVTRLLEQMARGESHAADELFAMVYDELRRIAAARLNREKPGQTLQATAIVNEAYVRLVSTSEPSWNSRGHFFTAAAEAMRRLLVDQARHKGRVRHGGQFKRLDFENLVISEQEAAPMLLELHEALERLEAEEPDVARVVTLRFFGGLSIAETASSLEISERTVNRHWAYAKAWLYRELAPDNQS